MAIAPLGRFVHERGRVLVHVSARAGCASAILPIAAAVAIEGQMRTGFRGPRVDRHGLSVCASHVPKHESSCSILSHEEFAVCVREFNSRHPPREQRRGDLGGMTRTVLNDLLNNDDDGRMMMMKE